MSSAGTYAYWPKVNNPNKVIPQMKSGEYQPAFFFGGSQVPVSLGIKVSGHTSGNGVYTGTKHRKEKINVSGTGMRTKGVETTARKHDPTMMARHMPSISR